jgi:hypothetical protein
MAKVKIICDRCGTEVSGLLTSGFTAGFYNVTQPNPDLRFDGGCWSKYGREREEFICDECMFADPEFIKVYGEHGRGHL